jgi:hypothetical protein
MVPCAAAGPDGMTSTSSGAAMMAADAMATLFRTCTGASSQSPMTYKSIDK